MGVKVDFDYSILGTYSIFLLFGFVVMVYAHLVHVNMIIFGEICIERCCVSWYYDI